METDWNLLIIINNEGSQERFYKMIEKDTDYFDLITQMFNETLISENIILILFYYRCSSVDLGILQPTDHIWPADSPSHPHRGGGIVSATAGMVVQHLWWGDRASAIHTSLSFSCGLLGNWLPASALLKWDTWLLIPFNKNDLMC